MQTETKYTEIKIVSLVLTVVLSFIVLAGVLAGDTDLIKTGVGVIANPGGSSNSSTRCESTITSCGKDGTCLDLTSLVYCVNGKIVETVCRYNAPKNQTTSTPCKNINFDLSVKDEDDLDVPTNLTLHKPGTDIVVKKFYIDGLSSVETFEKIVDFDIDCYDSKLLIKVKGLNLEKLDSTSSNIIIDDVNPNIPGTEVYAAYKIELPSNFTYSSITLSINYSETTVRDERDLTFYRCGLFDSNANTCNEDWSIIDTIMLDSENKVASININNFSVYASGEVEEQNTTTTTTIPQNTCEGFGYSGSCSDNTRCEIVQVTPTLSCCDCVSIETALPSQGSGTGGSSSSGGSQGSYTSSENSSTTTLSECIKHKPSVSVNPLSQSGIVGDTLQYDITVKNMDSTECDSREFEFDFEVPEGWTIDYDSIGMVEPGETELIEAMITSPEEAITNETYQLSVYVFDVDSGEESNIVNFKYKVNALPDTETKDEGNQINSRLTAFVSLIAGNKLVLISPVFVAMVGYVLWKTHPKWMMKESTNHYRHEYSNDNHYRQEYSNEKPREKIVVRVESDTQPQSNTPNPQLKQGQKNEKIRNMLIEEIRMKALREDGKIKKFFNY